MGVNYNGYSIEDLRQLASNSNSEIRVIVAHLLRTPADVLEKLADDDDRSEFVQEQAREELDRRKAEVTP